MDFVRRYLSKSFGARRPITIEILEEDLAVSSDSDDSDSSVVTVVEQIPPVAVQQEILNDAVYVFDSEVILGCNAAYESRQYRMQYLSERIADESREPDPTKRPVGGFLSCSVCSRQFYGRDGLHNHYKRFRAVDFNNLSTCCACGKQFDDIDALDRHYLVHAEELPFFCAVCGSEFRYLWMFLAHNQEPHTCMTCAVTFSDSDEYMNHINDFHPSSVCIMCCPSCNEGFTLLNAFETHLIECCAHREFACVYCRKRFIQQNYLHEHLMMMHYKESAKSHCELCGEYLHCTALLHHTRLHNLLQRFYRCTECDIKIGTKDAFTMHQHCDHFTDHISFRCKVCKIRYESDELLEKHINLVHPEVCDALEQEEEERKHKANKPNKDLSIKRKVYKCKNCFLDFRSKYVYMKHVREHRASTAGASDHLKFFRGNLIKRISCTICRQQVLVSEAESHRRDYHNNEVFFCTTCQTIFAKSYELNLHMKSAHSMFLDS